MQIVFPQSRNSALQATGWTWGGLVAETPPAKAAAKVGETLDTLAYIATLFAAMGIISVGVWTYSKLK